MYDYSYDYSDEELDDLQGQYFEYLFRDTAHHQAQHRDAADIFTNIIQPFFDDIESGVVDMWAPDPFFTYDDKPVSQELADKVVSELDDELSKEARRASRNVDANSDLMRAPPAARLAFAQRILAEFEKGKFPFNEWEKDHDPNMDVAYPEGW